MVRRIEIQKLDLHLLNSKFNQGFKEEPNTLPFTKRTVIFLNGKIVKGKLCGMSSERRCCVKPFKSESLTSFPYLLKGGGITDKY